MKHKRFLRLPGAVFNHENVAFVSTDANHLLSNTSPRSIYMGQRYDLRETPQYRKRMHHSNPDKLKMISSMQCGHLFPKCPRTQMSMHVPLASGGCPCQCVQKSIG